MKKLGDNSKNFLDKEVAFSKNTVQTDKLDIRFFKEVRDNNPKIKKKLEEAEDKYEPFPELQQDIFSSLYRYKPRRLKEHQVKTSHLLNWHVMGEVFESPKYKELRVLTRSDTINSTIGTEILGDEAYELVKKLKEQQEKLKELQDAENNFNAAGGQADQEKEEVGSQGGADNKKGKAVKGTKGWTLEEAKKKLEEARKAFRESMKKKEVKSQVNSMLKKANEQVTETSEMIQNWGLDGDDTFTSMPYHEKMKLLKDLRENKKLKKIAELAGRFKRIATQRQREKVKKGLDEIYNLSLGKELSKLIPQELMKLRHPITKKQFYRDFSEGKLLQYELRGKEKKQRGSIIVCIDNSGEGNA